MSREAVVLLVEDDGNDVALFRRALAKATLPTRVELKAAGNGEGAVQVLSEVLSTPTSPRRGRAQPNPPRLEDAAHVG